MFAAVGAEGEDDWIKLLLSKVKGKYSTELIADGRENLASVPSVGGAYMFFSKFFSGHGV